MSTLEGTLTSGQLAAYRRLPRSLRILTENALRNGYPGDAAAILAREAAPIRVTPTRLVMQDLLAVPLLADLASLRDEVVKRGGDPEQINPKLPTDLVIDHSMTVMHFGTADARRLNEQREIEINKERFVFLRWCSAAFRNLRVIPPGNGIVHQINLEQLATCAVGDDSAAPYPELVIGNDSHTPMINGLGVLGWGVGGLEAEAALLGNPLEIVMPKTVGVRLTGRLQAGASATDLALALTELLRKLGVVDQFVEFYGPALAGLSVPDRATVANMAPEYGATCAYFPIDAHVLDYFVANGHERSLIARIEQMASELELWNESSSEHLTFDRVVELDLDRLRPSVAGPARPHERVELDKVPQTFRAYCAHARRAEVTEIGRTIADGDIIVAAITSCTNTANPRAMIQAGLLARNAVKRGMTVPPGIKTSLAPGSLAVASYLAEFGLQENLDALGFNLVGFACTTCNGMSGPIAPPIAEVIDRDQLSCVAVLSGNRNFPGRIHPHAQANFIMSPALVVAFALAGSVRSDITREPLALDRDNKPVRLADIWPDDKEVDRLVAAAAGAGARHKIKASEESRAAWDALSVVPSGLYRWDGASTYLRPSPYFRITENTRALDGLRPITVLGDAINTDHIAPVGAIATGSAAGQFLIAHGTASKDFNSYGTRRASPEVVARSFFANPMLKNRLAEGRAGSFTRIVPDGDIVSIYEAVEHYAKAGDGLVILAGQEYGCGSSRDTAAKACYLAGVKAVVACSFERIHRSNLVNMGIWPLTFRKPDSIDTLGLCGMVSVAITDLPMSFSPQMSATATAVLNTGAERRFAVDVKIATLSEFDTLVAGGLLSETLAASVLPMFRER